MKRPSVALATIAVIAAAPAAARTVDYGRTDAQFQEDAAAINAPMPEPEPERGHAHVVVVDGMERLDHRLLILGISCRAWKVDNPLSQMVHRALSAWDADGELTSTGEGPLVRVSFSGASSTLRCVEVREMDMSCMVRTRIEGQVHVENAEAEPVSEPFAVEDEQLQGSPGVCASLSRGTGLSGRAAAHTLVRRLDAMASSAR